MADGRHIENRLLVISQRMIIRLTRNLQDKAESRSNTGHMTKIPNFENSRWRTVAILKIVLSLYLSRKSSDFNDIWYVDADCVFKVGYLTKYQNFANSKWRTVAISKIVFWLYLNEWRVNLINVKFCRIKQNHVLIQVI